MCLALNTNTIWWYIQKWSKGKQKEKVNNMVLFDQGTYDKLLVEAPKYKLITPSVLSWQIEGIVWTWLFLYQFLHILCGYTLNVMRIRNACVVGLEREVSWIAIIIIVIFQLQIITWRIKIIASQDDPYFYWLSY